MTEKNIQEILIRLSALEEAIFSKSGGKKQEIAITIDSYKGPTGGVTFLFQQGFFKAKRGLKEVRENLAENGYHYSRQAVHHALGSLSKSGGILIAIRDAKNILYAERK